MTATIVNANRVGPFIELEVCPNFDNKCNCEKVIERIPYSEVWQDTNNPKIPHKVFQYVADSPTWVNAKGKEVSFKENWIEHCANEALMLVEHEMSQFSKQNLDHLVGRKLTR